MLEECSDTNLKKAQKDWEKILLPEAKKMVNAQYDGLKKRYLQ
jgi:hypothetical protein